MKEIQKQFALVSARYPDWGDYIVLCECVKKKGYTDDIIKKAYKKFVLDCPVYGRSEKAEYIYYLIERTKNEKK